MRLLTLDLEMNQPSNKIIQIGYVVADTTTRKIILKRSLIVNPGETLNPFIIELTGITENRIFSEGEDLTQQYKRLLEDMKQYNIASLPAQWGWGDHNCIREQLNLSWDDYVFGRRSIDVKAIYQGYGAFSNTTTRAGLGSALKRLNMQFKGRPHDALDDAYNTYLLLEVMMDKMLLADKLGKIVK